MPQKQPSIWELLQGSQLPQMNTPNPNYVSPYSQMVDPSTSGVSMPSMQEVPTTQDQISQSVSVAQRSPASTPEAQVPSSWQAAPQVDPYASLMAQQEKLIRNGMNERRSDIAYNDQVKNTIMKNFSPQLDIAPLLAYADKLSGGNSLQAYKRPEEIQGRLGQVQNYANNIDRQRNALSDDDMNLLRMKLGIQQRKEDLSFKQAALAQKGTQKKALGAEDKNKLGLINPIMEGLTKLETMAPQYAGLSRSPLGGTKENDWTIQARLITENFGRLQSGGAITTDEEQKFLKMLPTMWDGEDISKKKIALLRDALAMRVSAITGEEIPQRQDSSRSPATTASVTVGEVRKGYKYNGGDPSKPESWSKQ